MNNIYNRKILLGNGAVAGTGWLPPMPGLRDYSTEHKDVKELGKGLGFKVSNPTIPASVDLRKWCSPIENQLSFGSCTANAGMGVVE